MMGRAGGHENQRILLDRAGAPLQDRLSFSIHEDEDLVHVRMDLLSDLLAGLQAHQYHLAVLARMNHLAKVPIVLGQPLNIPFKTDTEALPRRFHIRLLSVVASLPVIGSLSAARQPCYPPQRLVMGMRRSLPQALGVS